MKLDHKNIDPILSHLTTSTRSPRGRFSAENSWKLLEERMAFQKNRKKTWLRIASTAAVVLLAVSSWFIYNTLSPAPLQTIATLAETRIITLPDNTEVTLNHYSSITYPESFKKNLREVKLQGEAYFEVAKDTQHPFIVEAESIKVQVLGTHFNVEAYPTDNQIRTTLLEGSVAVNFKEQNAPLILAPNESATYNKVKGTIVHEKNLNASNEILWSQDILFFDRLPLHEIARQLSNAFHTKIQIKDTFLQNYRMTATFQEKESLAQILDLLSEVGHFDYKRTNDQINITSKLNKQ